MPSGEVHETDPWYLFRGWRSGTLASTYVSRLSVRETPSGVLKLKHYRFSLKDFREKRTEKLQKDYIKLHLSDSPSKKVFEATMLQRLVNYTHFRITNLKTYEGIKVNTNMVVKVT